MSQLRVGIVVGEVSGDKLGAALVKDLLEFYPAMEIAGVVGPELLAVGCEQLYPMDHLSIMGLWEPLKRLPELLRMRHWLLNYFLTEPPDLFIGIDAPDFNLGLEKKLRSANIPVVHYVSPSVWAWRQGRVKTIKKSVDLMLTLFPFEAEFYQKHNIPVQFVGHPLADRFPLEKNIPKQSEDNKVIALLPGSRWGEVKQLAIPYLQAAMLCFEQNATLRFVMPLISQEHLAWIKLQQEKLVPNLPISYMINNTTGAIELADIALVTSGTATLEVMIHKKPMIVAYKTNWLTYEIVRRMIRVNFIALPNLLADKAVVPELIQKEVTPQILSRYLLTLLKSNTQQAEQINIFAKLHQTLKKQDNKIAAESIRSLLNTQQELEWC